MIRLRGKIAALLIVLIVGGVFIPPLEGHVHAGESLVPASWRGEYPGPYVLDVTVAVDEEWIDAFGTDAEVRAAGVVEAASANLGPAGISLRLASVTSWRSSDDLPTIHPLLNTLEEAIPAGESGIVVGLTAGSFDGPVDGLANAGSPHLLIRHHPGKLARDAYVLTHEIGHVFGLDHHTCEDDLCFMADHGYDPNEHWCPDHLRLLTENGGYFDYIQS